MSKNISSRVPVLAAADIVSSNASKVGQSVLLADQYQKVGDRVVRYRIHLDMSYIGQSDMVAEVWSEAAGWVELVRLRPEVEFYIASGPAKDALNPKSRELMRIFDADKADRAAKSWQKVVALLAAEAKKVLVAIG